jgi:ribosome-associated protein
MSEGIQKTIGTASNPGSANRSRIADNQGVNPANPEPGRYPLGPGASVPEAALRFTFVASGGPGGQNVNKRATKAELRVALADLQMPEPARARLNRIAGRRLVDGELLFTSEVHRSQGQNRAECLDRLRELVLSALTPPRPRKKTRPSRGSVERRLESKRRIAEAKRRRRSPD